MKSIILYAALGLIVVSAMSCGKSITVPVPPRIDLEVFQAIGLIEFSSNSEGNLDQFASQKFLQSVQACQSVVVVELGDSEELLETVGHDKMDLEAIKAIGKRYDLDGVIVGTMEVKDVTPSMSLYNMVSSMSFSADVEASLTARLYDTHRGATLWTKSAKGVENVANLGLTSGKTISFDAQDPESAYGKLVNGLVYRITDDFRVHYVKQKVK